VNVYAPGRRAVVAVLLTLLSLAVAAQGYPFKPVKMIVPSAPGGVTDILARTVGQRLGDAWGQPVQCSASCMHKS